MKQGKRTEEKKENPKIECKVRCPAREAKGFTHFTLNRKRQRMTFIPK